MISFIKNIVLLAIVGASIPLNSYSQNLNSLPDFSELSTVTGAFVARICMHQVFEIPEGVEIDNETKEQIKRCILLYREIFDDRQLDIIRKIHYGLPLEHNHQHNG